MKSYLEKIDNFKKKENIKSFKLYENRSDDEIKISIIKTTYNRDKMLKECIMSTFKQNTKTKYEILILDNNLELNNLKNLDFIKENKINNISYYKHEKNLGAAGNFNRGIELSKGKYIVFLHDDGLMKKNYIEQISLILSQKKDLKLLTTGLIVTKYGANKNFTNYKT